MKGVRVSGLWARWEGMTWPLPDSGDSDVDSLEWVLRYGTPTREQILVAASYIHAYGRLIGATGRTRAEVVRTLRAAQAQQDTNDEN